MKKTLVLFFACCTAVVFTAASSCCKGKAESNSENPCTDSICPVDTSSTDTARYVCDNNAIPHEGFVYVKTLIPDLVEDLRYFTSNNFMGAKADGYEANRVILSEPAAKALKQAADEFRELGYVIKIYDAYRPQQAVDSPLPTSP